MRYRLVFKIAAKKEWDKLNGAVREQFKKKLAKCLENPRVPSARLSGMPDCYKIKLRSVGYRLVYQVRDEALVVAVMAVGKRERNAVYQAALRRV